jgi:hypothetical protein
MNPPIVKEFQVIKTHTCAIIVTVAFVLLFFACGFLGASDKELENPDDAVITSEVKEALLFHLLLYSKTETAAGVVTLSGNADDMAEKDLGTTIATSIKGVRTVINHMTIRDTLATSGRVR